MLQDMGQTRQHNDEITLFEIIHKLIESKKIIIIITLIITISAFLYSLQKQPTYQSSVLIEIGHYDFKNGSIELIEQPNNIIQDLNINFKLKADNDLSSTEINVKEQKLIEVQYLSNSPEKNIEILNQFLNYLYKRHTTLADSMYLDKRAELSRQLDYINKEIEINKNFERLKISSQIQELEIQIPTLEHRTSNLKKIITEDEENLRILKVSPDLYLERTKVNPTLNQVIHMYKEKLADLNLEKGKALILKSNLEKKINLLENNQLPTAQISSLLEKKDELRIELNDLENQNFYKTQTIGEIETLQLDSNKLTIIVGGFLVGLIVSIFFVFISNFISAYRKSLA